MTPKKENRVLNGVNEITPGRSAMSENQKVVEVPEEFGNLCQKQLHTRPVAFRPHLSMGLVLSNVVFSSLKPKPWGGNGGAF